MPARFPPPWLTRLPAPVRTALLRLYALVWLPQPLALEIFLMLLAGAWGGWVLDPAVDTFASTPTFRLLGRIAPEAVWGGLALLGALAQGAAIWREDWRARRVAAFVGVWFWAVLAWSFIYSNVATTGTVTYTLFALGQGWVYWRLGRGRRWTPASG